LRPKSREFPVIFPVSREFRRRKVSARLRAPPRSLARREYLRFFHRNARNMPVFATIPNKIELEKTDHSAAEAVALLVFLWRAHSQSGFNNSVKRMQCDHKPMTRRKLFDFGTAFLGNVPHFLAGETKVGPDTQARQEYE
jgi:hypothetical protein